MLRTAVSAPTGRRTVVATANEQSRPEISKHGEPFALTGVRVLDRLVTPLSCTGIWPAGSAVPGPRASSAKRGSWHSQRTHSTVTATPGLACCRRGCSNEVGCSGPVHWGSLGRCSKACATWRCSALTAVKVIVDIPKSAAAAVFSARSSMKRTCSGAASMMLSASMNTARSGLSRRSRQL